MITRRSLLKSLAVGTAAVAVPSTLLAQNQPDAPQTAADIEALTVKGNIRQSVSKWTFGRIPMDEFCKICKKLGMVGVDLVNENEWDIVNSNDMIVTMGNAGFGIARGFNNRENHDALVERYEHLIPIAAAKKVPNLICMSGNRGDIGDEEGMENCVIGLKRIIPLAERHGVTLQMELLNSLVDHADYHADRTAWAAEIARKIGSERFKLLYDIYHMQIMEGNVISTIRNYQDVIGHYHTAGIFDGGTSVFSGRRWRRDLDDQQDLYYPAIMRAILETDFKGFVAHEFIPKNGLQSLREAVAVCDV